jgi:hypothetical protein
MLFYLGVSPNFKALCLIVALNSSSLLTKGGINEKNEEMKKRKRNRRTGRKNEETKREGNREMKEENEELKEENKEMKKMRQKK